MLNTKRMEKNLIKSVLLLQDCIPIFLNAVRSGTLECSGKAFFQGVSSIILTTTLLNKSDNFLLFANLKRNPLTKDVSFVSDPCHVL